MAMFSFLRQTSYFKTGSLSSAEDQRLVSFEENAPSLESLSSRLFLLFRLFHQFDRLPMRDGCRVSSSPEDTV